MVRARWDEKNKMQKSFITSWLSVGMARGMFLVSLLVLSRPWIFEVEVEAEKLVDNGKFIIVHIALLE